MPGPCRIASCVVFLAFVAAGCGGEGDSSGPAGAGAPNPVSGADTGSAPAPAGTEAIPEVLAFEAPLLGGGTFRGVDHAGKDVAFWFWAPW